MYFKLTKDHVPEHTKGLLLKRSVADGELQLRQLSSILEGCVDDMKHLLARLVLVAVRLAILVAATGELEVGGLEHLLEAAAPEGAGIRIYSIVGGLADEAEGSEILVGFEVGGDVLVELCRICQHARRSFGAIVKGQSLTSIGRASKPFQAMLSMVGIVCCGDGM